MSRLRIDVGSEPRVSVGFRQLRGLPEQIDKEGAVRVTELVRALGGCGAWVTFRARDGFTTTLPMAALSSALLVYRDGEEPVWPYRLLVDDASVEIEMLELDDAA